MKESNLTLDKLPPQNIEAEQSVLGAILLDNNALYTSFELITQDDFYKDSNRKIFIAITELLEKNEPIDIISLTDHLRKKDNLDAVGGVQYLTSLASMIPTSANVRFHSKIVREKLMVWGLLRSVTDIARNVYESEQDAEELIDYAEKTIFDLSEKRISPSFSVLKDVIKDSLEMAKEQLAFRMLCSEAMVDSNNIRKGFIRKDDWHKLTSAAGKLAQSPIFIDDSSAISVLEMRAKARRLKVEHGLSLIIVDYLQLMRGRGKTERREQEISEISRSLKGLAKELRVPVIALSQLNRGVETRTGNKKPTLADLRESGAIEQDDDEIIFLYRDEVYNKDSNDNKGKAEIIISKQRNGPTGE